MPDCPLYPYNPYGKSRVKIKRKVSQKTLDALKMARQSIGRSFLVAGAVRCMGGLLLMYCNGTYILSCKIRNSCNFRLFFQLIRLVLVGHKIPDK